MAIRLITGVPGSGKTFYAVKHLRDNYFKYNSKQDAWVPKRGITLITNIDRLKLEHLNLEEILTKYRGGIKEFLTVPVQEKVSKKYPRIVYFLDECQQYFPRKFYDEQVFYYFQYHRHLGHDVYLVTQSINIIPKEIKELCEVEIRGVRRGLSVFGEFKYKVMAGMEIVDHKMIKKSKSVFNLYKSMNAKETERIKNPIIKYLALALIGIVIGLFLFKRTFFGGALASEKKRPQEKTEIPRTERIEKVKRSKKPIVPTPETEFVLIGISHVLIGDELKIIDYFTGEMIPPRWAKYDLITTSQGDCLKIFAKIPKEKIKPSQPDPGEKTPTEKKSHSERQI